MRIGVIGAGQLGQMLALAGFPLALRFQFLWGSVFVAYDQEVLRDDLDLSTVNAGLRFEF